MCSPRWFIEFSKTAQFLGLKRPQCLLAEGMLPFAFGVWREGLGCGTVCIICLYLCLFKDSNKAPARWDTPVTPALTRLRPRNAGSRPAWAPELALKKKKKFHDSKRTLLRFEDCSPPTPQDACQETGEGWGCILVGGHLPYVRKALGSVPTTEILLKAQLPKPETEKRWMCVCVYLA